MTRTAPNPQPATTTPPPLPPVVAEEADLLRTIRRTLLEHPEGAGASEAQIIEQLVTLQREIRTARTDDRPALHQQIAHLSALLDQVRKGRHTEEVDPDSPYFGHLRLSEAGRTRDIFLGRATRLSDGLRIVDWRNAPISRLFYRYQEGDDYVEEMAHRQREGTIATRRTLHIERGELLRVDTPQRAWLRQGQRWAPLSHERQRLAGGQGSALRAGRSASAALGSGGQVRADKHLPDIAALIDPDQFALITSPASGAVVLRGSAGSGKTTVALHRIAYLAYALGPRFAPQRVLVIVWGRAMRDYVAHVLPALGVNGVTATTWTDWARKQVLRHFPHLPSAVSDDTPEPVTRLKLHPGVMHLIERKARGRGPRTGDQAIDDWAYVLTDRRALADAVGDDFSARALQRAVAWCSDQVRAVVARNEGDREVDARLDPEDDALLLRAWQVRVGPLRARRRQPLQLQHLVLDEVQDFSPIEVRVLLDACDDNQSVTLAGDTRQAISSHTGFHSWQEFLDDIEVESTALSTLEVSYRSTHPIIRFAIEVLDRDDEPLPRTTRDGPPVELFQFSEHGACVAFLAEELKRLVHTEPLANIALLTPDPATSRLYAEGLLAAEVPDVRLVHEQRFAFAPGIDVVEADQVKGLEFDYVIIIEASARHWPDTPHYRRLLHVAATRAVHQLWLTAVGSPSPILPALDGGLR